MQQEPTSVPSKDLRAYIATVRHQKWPILLAVVVTVAAALFFTSRQVPQYTSEGRVLVRPKGALGISLTGSTTSIDMPTERFTATSTDVAEEVIKTYERSETPEELLSGLTVDIEPETQVLRFGYSDASPQKAQILNNAFMESYLALRIADTENLLAKQREPLQEKLNQLKRSIKSLGQQIHKNPENASLQSRIGSALYQQAGLETTIRGLTPDPESGGEVSTPASRPTTPSSPSYPRNIALAIMIGLALGLGTALLREHLSEGLKGSKDLEEAIRGPVLAAVPRVPGWRRRSETHLIARDLPKSSAAEAYRTLRTNLQYIADRDDLRVVAVTSATLGEGKTTTAANLGVTLAQTGKRVIIVSCDLRKPRLHRFFGLTNDIGVTNILRGEATLAQAAQRPEGIDSLRVLSSGPVPSNPAELLGSAEMDALLGELRLFADIVLIDTPPILAVSDSLILGPRSDGVVIVADAHNSSRGAVEHTREQLDQVGAAIIGCVFNNFDPSQAKYYPYDKRYYYSSYTYAEDPDKRTVPTNGNTEELATGNGHKAEEESTEELWH